MIIKWKILISFFALPVSIHSQFVPYVLFIAHIAPVKAVSLFFLNTTLIRKSTFQMQQTPCNLMLASCDRWLIATQAKSLRNVIYVCETYETLRLIFSDNDAFYLSLVCALCRAYIAAKGSKTAPPKKVHSSNMTGNHTTLCEIWLTHMCNSHCETLLNR